MLQRFVPLGLTLFLLLHLGCGNDASLYGPSNESAVGSGGTPPGSQSATGAGGAMITTSSAGQGGQGGQGMVSSSSGGVVGSPCHYDDAPSLCSEGLFCQAPGCREGSCQAPLLAGQSNQERKPVCGCDGVTYYNSNVAKVFQESVRHVDVCMPNEAQLCSNTTPCKGQRRCNLELPGLAECIDVSNAKGSCWGLPKPCGREAPMGVACGLGMPCLSYCALVKGELPWHAAAWCF